jgi:superfamily II DNA or RNA helicase
MSPTLETGSAKSRAARNTKRAKAKAKKISRLRKPEDMSLEAWQIALRRQFAQEQKFSVKNTGPELVFSDFEVTNPATERTYRVAIRGSGLGENYCSCPDYAVNTLGTCKHIEYVLERLGRRRGAKAALALGFQPEYSQVYLQYGARREVVFRPGTQCPPALADFAKRFFDANGRLEPDAFFQFHHFLKRISAEEHEVRCYPDALELIARVRDRKLLAEKIDERFPAGVRSAGLRTLIRTSLYAYQAEGALFAAKAGRCLLADEMGLGKTIQAIAAAEILAQTAGIERVLVVSPTSLKHQWKQEIEKFTDRDAVVVEGLSPEREKLYAAPSFYKLTNYDVIPRDLEPIGRWQPDLIILDEAQRIKNWKTRTAQSVKRLQSPFALVLTGTPLENRLEELHSIVEFVDRFRLGPMFRFLDAHQHVDETGRVVGYRNLSKISETLDSILVRRTKDKVLSQLPPRLEKRFFVPMTPQQWKYHNENKEIVAQLVAKWRRYHFLSESDQLRLQMALQNMRMSCNSTYLLDKKTDYGVKADELAELLEEIFEDREAKVVVFSQWVRMQELVVRRLQQRKWGHVVFNGSVPGRNRKTLVQRFKEDADCRLFLSTDAGGVGLNLQNASAVVILDQPWNPAVLEQRIGRVHRLGQQRPVRVCHFVSQGSIEEGMLGVLAFKKALFGGALDGGDDEVFLKGTRLKQFMDSVDKVTASIPQPMPESTRTGDGSGRSEHRPEGERAPRGRRPSTAAASPAPRPAVPADALAGLVAAGASFLEKLAGALSGGPSGGLPESLIVQDEQTGQPFIKFPLPEPEMIQSIVNLLGAFAKR